MNSYSEIIHTIKLSPVSLTLGAIGSLVLITLTVNTRFLLLNASMRPWFGALPAWQSYPMLAINTDVGAGLNIVLSVQHAPTFLRGPASGLMPADPSTYQRLMQAMASRYAGKIKMWNDPAIAADNAGAKLPSTTIAVAHRSDSSGTSYIFTNYLSPFTQLARLETDGSLDASFVPGPIDGAVWSVAVPIGPH